MCVVVVHHMKVAVPTPTRRIPTIKFIHSPTKSSKNSNFNFIPRHSLNQPLTKVIEGNGDLHVLVRRQLIAVPQQHHLVMVRQVVVGYGFVKRLGSGEEGIYSVRTMGSLCKHVCGIPHKAT